MSDRRFKLPADSGVIIISSKVLSHMYQHAQTSFWKHEAGGQLFSHNPTNREVSISVATGPYLEDKRGRHSFFPNRVRAANDAVHYFKKGLHVVGLWHTHPQKIPQPSHMDQQAATLNLQAHDDAMTTFLLLTLGNYGNPLNISIYASHRTLRSGWHELPELKT